MLYIVYTVQYGMVGIEQPWNENLINDYAK